ncbi:MAG: transcription elongation factor GreA [Bdellovibrionaceae bacterium]|nr:transcription elongation factor GreA [Pseudobdellovibrionaceae bacterium]
MSDKVPMTQFGKLKLEAEYKDLMQNERPAVIKAIEEARSHGDLSENADYDAAKERQAFVEARISDIKGKLANAEVFDTAKLSSEKVIFGAIVELLDLETNEKISYQIVGEDESDVKQGKISVYSPLARSIIGRKKGDAVEFKSPKGEKEYEILNFYFK